jgi:hypothetical protein
MRREQEIIQRVISAELVLQKSVADERLFLPVNKGRRGNVQVHIRAELAQEQIGPQVLGKSHALVFAAKQVENILVGQGTAHQPAQVHGAMRPGIGSGQDAGRAGGGVVSARVVGVVHEGALRQPFQVGSRPPFISIQGQVGGRHGVCQQDNEVGLFFLQGQAARTERREGRAGGTEGSQFEKIASVEF